MTLWVSLWVLGTALVAALAFVPAAFPALVADSHGSFVRGRLRTPAHRIRAAGDHLVGDLGRVGASVLIYAAGLAVIGAVCWLLGKLAGAVQGLVDWPVFRSAQAGRVGWLVRINDVLTLMGNRAEIKIVAVAAGVLLAVLYKRRWWVPVVALFVVFSVEHYLQQFLGLTVHRGHPPTTLGTWPSGGCARLVSVYGLMIWLYLRNRLHRGRRSAAALWGLLVIAAWLEGFSRVILLKHWFTDVLGGWIFGALLLGATVAALAALDPMSRREVEPTGGAPLVEATAQGGR